MLSFIQSFGLLFLAVVIFSFLIKLFKQPIIIGYVLSGLFFSVFISYSEVTKDEVSLFAELGITFLLFLMGLEMDLKNLRYLGKDIFISTFLQSAIFFALGFFVSRIFGFSPVESIYLSTLFMFSSTLLVAKWVEDKKEVSSLKGRMILGILVVQDLFAIIIMTVLNGLKEQSMQNLILIPIQGIVLIGGAFFFSRFILNYILKFAVKYPELLFISSLGVCFLFTEIAPLLGYSTTIGAFVAGVTLANTNYKNETYSRLKPLIIFFNMLFFVGLGLQMDINIISSHTIIYLAVLFLLSFILKPIFIHLTLKMRGYDAKTSFTAGLNLAQFSEFGVIIIAGGIASGIISSELGTISILGVVITMIISSYLIKYDSEIYNFFRKPLLLFDRFFMQKEFKEPKIDLLDYNVIFFGYYELSQEMFKKLQDLGKKILVIENDPVNIKLLRTDNIPYLYGSVTNPYFLSKFDFSMVNLVVSSLMDEDDTKSIIKYIKSDNPSSTIIVTAKNVRNSLELYETGADYVIYPSYVNEQHVSILLEDYAKDINNVLTKKLKDIDRFNEMKKKRENTKSCFDINRFLGILSKKDRK